MRDRTLNVMFLLTFYPKYSVYSFCFKINLNLLEKVITNVIKVPIITVVLGIP